MERNSREFFVTEYKQLIPFNHSSSLRQLSGIGNTSFNDYTHHTRVVSCFSSMVHAATDLIIQLTCGDNGKLQTPKLTARILR